MIQPNKNITMEKIQPNKNITMEKIEQIIDTTFPGANHDIFRNDTSGFICTGQNDGWHYYLKEKSERYQRDDYEAYYYNIYEPYLQLSEEYPEIVDEIQTTCQKWLGGQIDNSNRLYEYLVDIITTYQTQFDQKEIEEWD